MIAFLLTITATLLIGSMGFHMNPLKVLRKSSHSHMIPVISPQENKPTNDFINVGGGVELQALEAIFDSNYEDKLNSEGISILLFTASWCGPCKNMANSLLKCSRNLSRQAKFYQIDTDYNPESTSNFHVRSIPSVLMFKDGQVVAEIVGNVPPQVIEAQVQKYLDSSSNTDDLTSFQ